MRNATVYYSVLGPPEQIEATTKALLRARKFINFQLGEQLAMRYTPQLRFVFDETAERAQRIERLLRDIDGQPEQGPNAEEPGS